MGKVTGFKEFERLEEGYKPVTERLKHYKEFVIGLDDKQAKTQAARCMDCGTPFCNNGCPVNNIIPDFNDTAEDAKAFVAYFKEIGIHEVNLLPYHNFGELKYKQLNRVYRLSSVKNYHPEDLSDYLEVFTDAQVKASF